MRSERNQTQTIIYCVTSFIQNFKNRQIHRYNGLVAVMAKDGEWEQTIKGNMISWWGEGNESVLALDTDDSCIQLCLY